MSVRIKEENLQNLFSCFSDPEVELDWSSIYTLPLWLKTWWDNFGETDELMIRSLWQDGQPVGIAPLRSIKGQEEARLIGNSDLCDYLDCIIAPHKEKAFFDALLPALRDEGIKRLTLEAQRPDASVFNYLAISKIPPGCSINFEEEDQSYELPLPATWDDYLGRLKKKQRHEVRRKLRRLEDETEGYSYREIRGQKEIEDFFPCFLELFTQNPEKADFLTDQMEEFFKGLLSAAAEANLARFGLLEIDGFTAAAILYFNYRKRTYLYNSAYSSDYASLSAGLLSKVLSIKESIESGQSVYDFLKGREVYKSRLGGEAVPVYKVIIELGQ